MAFAIVFGFPFFVFNATRFSSSSCVECILSMFLQDFRIIGIVAIITGIVVSQKKSSTFSRFLLVATVSHIFFLFYTNFMLSNSFSIGMFERFLISLYAVLTLYVGIGFNHLYEVSVIYVKNNTNKK